MDIGKTAKTDERGDTMKPSKPSSELSSDAQFRKDAFEKDMQAFLEAILKDDQLLVDSMLKEGNVSLKTELTAIPGP